MKGIPHGVLAPVKIGDWEVPAGTMVMPLQWATNMDPEIWSQPEMFRPERFLDSEGELRSDKHIYPFQVRTHFNTMSEGNKLFSKKIGRPGGGLSLLRDACLSLDCTTNSKVVKERIILSLMLVCFKHP